jgi:hypothetical protein
MAKAAKKKKFKFDITLDLFDKKFDDLKKEAKDWLKSQKLDSYMKPIKHQFEAELDERKYNEAKLTEDAYYAIRMGVKILDQVVKKAKEKNKPDDAKKGYDKFVGEAKYGLEKWEKELASGKADNAKALKDGKAAMDKLDKLDFKGAFENPRKTCVAALEKLAKGDKPDPREVERAAKTFETVQALMEKQGKEAENAISFLVKTAEKTKDDDATDDALKSFAGEVLKHEDTFNSFLEGAGDFGEALDEAIGATKGGEMDKAAVEKLLERFEKLKSLEGAAQECLKIAKKLSPQFKKIAGKLK